MAIPGKNSFLLFHDQRIIFDSLSDAQAGQLIKMLYAYSDESKIPYTNGDALLGMAFSVMKSALDRSQGKYNRVTARDKENGSRGGRPKNPVGSEKPSGLKNNPKNPSEPRKADSDSVRDSDSDF